MRRGSIIQAGTDWEGKKLGSFSQKGNSRKKSTRPRTFISQF